MRSVGSLILRSSSRASCCSKRNGLDTSGWLVRKSDNPRLRIAIPNFKTSPAIQHRTLSGSINSQLIRYDSLYQRSKAHGDIRLSTIRPVEMRLVTRDNNFLAVMVNHRHYTKTCHKFTDKSDKIPSGNDTDQMNNLHEMGTDLPTSKHYHMPGLKIKSNEPSEPSVHNISYLPESFHPYAHLSRLDKPIGTYLLLHPCLWSTALATPLGTFPDLTLCTLFGIGAFVMRGAGCTINDMWDARYDREVERTKSRPLASGVLNYRQATAWLALQLTAGLAVLVSLPNVEQCFLWGVASLPLVATYPLMKRYTDYPQVVLGMTFNWGAILGWLAVRGDIDWSVVGPLYASGVAWTLVYDTLYAHQDKKDDAKLGLKSTALTFGENTKPILSVLAATTWAGWMTAGYNCGFGIPWEAPYYYVGCTAAAAHLLWQIQSADLSNSENLAYRFRSNNLVGWVMLGSCTMGNVMAC